MIKVLTLMKRVIPLVCAANQKMSRSDGMSALHTNGMHYALVETDHPYKAPGVNLFNVSVICVYTLARTHTRKHTHTHTHTHPCTYAHTHTHARTRAHTHTRMRTHTRTHTDSKHSSDLNLYVSIPAGQVCR